MSQSILRSHGSVDSFDAVVAATRARLQQAGDQPDATVAEQLALLDGMTQFGLGRYALQHKGVNGYWTDYFASYGWKERPFPHPAQMPLSELESFCLTKAPIILASRERFHHFRRLNQEYVKEGATLATIPSGIMGELLYLDYTGITSLSLVAIDYDQDSLRLAEELATQRHLQNFLTTAQQDAWALPYRDHFDLISSSGLNIYEPDEAKTIALYQQFYQALKPGGALHISFLTPPPFLTDQCEWQMAAINQNDLRKQKLIFSDIVQANFRAFCSSERMREILTEVGFHTITFYYDTAHIFPIAKAVK